MKKRTINFRFVNGQYVDLIESSKQGSGHVHVVIQKLGYNKDQRRFYRIGKQLEAFGGFKRGKDFNYLIAEQVAIENALSHAKRV